MEKNQRNPRKRLNSLILLVAFTAVMLIVSTYAWFSTQKTVTIGNLEGKVNVAEGLEISLDALNWSQEIDFSDFEPVSGGDIGEYQTTLATRYGETAHNILPSELIPVSTTGETYVENGNTHSNEIQFYNGHNTNSDDFDKIIAVNPTQSSSAQPDFAGYYAIDLFLKNSSKLNEDPNGDGNKADAEQQGTAKETLQLNTTSNAQLVSTGNTATGLQNTLRLALALYEPYTTAGGSVAIDLQGEDGQSKIIDATTTVNSAISDVAIWEPNADKHVDYIVTNNNDITWDATQKALYLLAYTYTDEDGDEQTMAANARDNKFRDGDILPTYGLLAGSIGKTITDIYDWSGTNSATMKKQVALQTKYSATADNFTTVDGGVRNLISIDSDPTKSVYEYGQSVSGKDHYEDGAVEFQIYKNQVSRVRMYVWLEGQDVDCINFASHGGGVHLDLGLVKGATPGQMAES